MLSLKKFDVFLFDYENSCYSCTYKLVSEKCQLPNCVDYRTEYDYFVIFLFCFVMNKYAKD